MRLLTLFRLPFFLAVLLALAAAVAGAWWAVLLAAGVAGVIFLLGRDPQRRAPSRPLGVVSPIDGRVVAAGRGRDPFLDRDAEIVRIRQGMVTPAILHSPIEGRVERIWGGPLMPGKGERVAIHVRTDEGDDIVFALSGARLPGPLHWTVQPGERVGQGQRRGLAGWGREVRLFLPAGSRPEVEWGDHVHAGVDVVAQLIHSG